MATSLSTIFKIWTIFLISNDPASSLKLFKRPKSSETIPTSMGAPLEVIGTDDLAQEQKPGKPLDHSDFAKGDLIALKDDNIDEDPNTSSERNLLEGDIIVPDLRAFKEIRSHSVDNNPENLQSRSAIADSSKLWPEAIIPFMISSEFDSTERARIAKAMNAFQNETCIRFIPQANEQDYIYIVKGTGCSSSVGRQRGQQTVSLDDGCMQLGIIIHEFMHASGFWHEHSRADRDDYVNIITSNIKPAQLYNFNKYEWGYIQHLSVPYDTGSVMHYNAHAFSRNNQPTIVTLDRSALGQRKYFSQNDVKKLNLLYKCVEITKPTEGNGVENCFDHYDQERCKAWSKIGECGKNSWMMENCKMSCNNCELKGNGVENCFDYYAQEQWCKAWSEIGECGKNSWMMENCKKSCNNCELTGNGVENCFDYYNQEQNCKAWSEIGECGKNWMMENCKKSCNNCELKGRKIENCYDTHDEELCTAASELGNCEKNPWIMKNCKKSCNNCE